MGLLQDIVHGIQKAGSAGTGAALGTIGSMVGVLGADPQRSTVPAYAYGKVNPAFGAAYNVASKPGSVMARGENAVVGALQHLVHPQAAAQGMPYSQFAQYMNPSQLQVRPQMQHGQPNLGVSTMPIQGRPNPGAMQMQSGGYGGAGYTANIQSQAHNSWQGLGGYQNMVNPQVQDNGYYFDN